MKRVFLTYFLLIYSIFNIYSNTEILPPLQEMSRTLSPPSKIWTLGPGIGGYSKLQDEKVDYGIDFSYINFAFPYSKFGNSVEIHYFLPMTKFYLIKNVETENNIYSITGANLALFFGITGLKLSDDYANSISYGTGFQFKNTIGDHLWFILNGRGEFDFNLDWSFLLETGIGFQLSDHISILPHVLVSIYEYSFLRSNLSDIENALKTFAVTIPLDFKINITNRHSIRIGLRAKYSQFINTDISAWTFSGGIQYSLFL